MFSNINIDLIPAFNPLYIVPIVAVIFCAFIVYAFGFKSPVPPPSFDGLEEEKKYSKKRKVKENQKSNKLLQNGKSNGSAVNKNSVVSSKKRDTSEKNAATEKPASVEKSTVTEKKANKKNKVQHERKALQEKKKENIPHDDLNDDGWVQLVSKKGRKNRKRDDVTVSETQSNPTTVEKVEETKKSNGSSQVEESPKNVVELPKDIALDQKQPTLKAKAAKEEGLTLNMEKTKMQNIVVEVPKSDNNNIEKQPLIEAAPKGSKVLEESNKSKKKKKKQVESNASEIESTNKIISNVSESAVKGTSLASPVSKETTNVNPTIVAEISQSIGKVEVDQPSEVKSNVAFDELAGLYPETKEQKKKKKVRRDH